MTTPHRSNEHSATPEQLDYLAWYLGGDSEYPCYETDACGSVKTDGYTNETSLDAIRGDDGEISVAHEQVVRGDFPSPEDALARFFGSSHLATLSKRERQVFILMSVCGMWPREIAAHLGISAQTAKNVLQRAKKKFNR